MNKWMVAAALMAFSIGSQAQNVAIDTLFLEDVQVKRLPKKIRYSSKKKGVYEHVVLSQSERGTASPAFLGRYTQLPKGELQTLRFIINDESAARVAKKEMNPNPLIKVLLYTIGADGQPAENLDQDVLVFQLPQGHQGEFAVDVSDLEIQSQPLFIGLAYVDSREMARKQNVYIYSRASEDYHHYYINGMNTATKWQLLPSPLQPLISVDLYPVVKAKRAK